MNEKGAIESVETARKRYESPKLVFHGSLTKLTAGSKNQNTDKGGSQTKNTGG
jgi:hypothetical protein